MIMIMAVDDESGSINERSLMQEMGVREAAVTLRKEYSYCYY